MNNQQKTRGACIIASKSRSFCLSRFKHCPQAFKIKHFRLNECEGCCTLKVMFSVLFTIKTPDTVTCLSPLYFYKLSARNWYNLLRYRLLCWLLSCQCVVVHHPPGNLSMSELLQHNSLSGGGRMIGLHQSAVDWRGVLRSGLHLCHSCLKRTVIPPLQIIYGLGQPETI